MRLVKPPTGNKHALLQQQMEFKTSQILSHSNGERLGGWE